MGGTTGLSQQPLGIQALDDQNVYLIACDQGLYVYRWNQSTSTMLTFPPPPAFLYPPPQVVQRPHTADLYFAGQGLLYSFPWNISTLPKFEPPVKTHGYNRTVCPYICNTVGLVFAPIDGSVVYVACAAAPCDLLYPSFVSAIDLTTNQTIAINTTWAQSHNTSQLVWQNITQLSYIHGTNELLIVSQQYGVTVYNTNHIMEMMRAERLKLSSSLPSSSSHSSSLTLEPTQAHVLLTASACFNPVGTIIDRRANLLIAYCNNQTIVWNLTSKTNITIDPQSGIVVYPQSQSQVCGAPFLLYHHSKRTLYQSCGNGPDRVFALQNLATPQSALFTSLVNVDTCSSTSFLMTDHTQPDALYSMCAEGMMRMEGRGLTSIPIGNVCQSQSALVYDWRTDATYITCGLPSPPLLRFHNHHDVEVLMDTSNCSNPLRLIFDDESNSSRPQLFLVCANIFNFTIWNISLGLGDAYIPPQSLFTLPGFSSDCAYSHAHSQFYCFVLQKTLWTYNISTPDLPPERTSLVINSEIAFVQVCADWLFFTCQSFEMCLLGLPINRIGIDQPTVLFGTLTVNISNTVVFTNIACDAKRKTSSVATYTNAVQLIQVNVTDSTNPIVTVNAFLTGGIPMSLLWLGIDTELNRVYILQEAYVSTTQPDYLVIFDGNTRRFVPSVTVATVAAPFVTGIFVDSHTSQVFMSLQASSDYTYDQVLILTSGWRCTTGTSWYQGSCLPCPIAKNRSIVLSTDESTYLIPKCGTCGAGGIADSVGTIECKQCEVGRFADINVGQVCSLCIGGFYANQSGSIACSPCESGRYSNTSESSFCYSADPGSYVGAEGQSMQFRCPSGSYSNTSTAISCQQCVPGRYAAFYGTSNCSYAQPGSYVDQYGQNYPVQCASGRFSNTSGVTFCYECDFGTFTPSLGVSQCENAVAGSFVAQTGQTSEQLCPSGRYTNTTRATFCYPCEVGTYAGSYGSVKCKLATAGYYTDYPGQSTQFQCLPGRFSNTSGLTMCYECDIGRYAAEYGRSNCTAASGGYYIPISGQSAQIECPSGRFSNTFGATSCTTCDRGHYSATFGAKYCTPADAGFYVDQLGQNSPQPCPSGTFNSAKGSTSCQACGAGTFASLPSSTSCEPCSLGRFSASAASDCPTCSADAYTPQVGADCLSCIDQEGLECTNGLAMVAAGWWPYLINDPSFDPPLQVYRTTQCPPDYCDGAALQFASSNEKPKLCQSPRLNSPDNWLCAECEDGYIAWGSSCEPCTGPDVGLICGALILTFIIAYVLLRIDPAASPLTILFFFVQIAALEVGSVTRWIDWIQFANLGAHSFQRCLAPLTPAQQMILTLCIPFLLTTALGILCTLHRLISKYVTPSQWYQSFIFSSSSSPQPSSRFIRFIGWCSMSYDRDRYLGAINAILIFCYTPVTVTVVSALHCVEVGPPNISRLFSTPSIDCHSTEYRVILLPIVYVWLCCYVIGLPLFMLLFVWRRWQTVATILAASESSFGFGFGGESMQQVGSSSSSSSSSSGQSHDANLNFSSLNNSSSVSSSSPAAAAAVISFHLSTHDSLLLSSSPESNPMSSSHSFDARWGHFYRRYRLSAWYWQPIEMIQRFAFALTSVLLIKDSHARYSLYSTISIISLSANLWSRPFASDRMNHVALAAYFLLSFVSFLLNGRSPPYSLTTQLMFFALIVPFSVILFVWGIRVNVMGMKQQYLKTNDGRVALVPSLSSISLSSSSSILPPRMPRSASAIANPPPSLSEPLL